MACRSNGGSNTQTQPTTQTPEEQQAAVPISIHENIATFGHDDPPNPGTPANANAKAPARPGRRAQRRVDGADPQPSNPAMAGWTAEQWDEYHRMQQHASGVACCISALRRGASRAAAQAFACAAPGWGGAGLGAGGAVPGVRCRWAGALAPGSFRGGAGAFGWPPRSCPLGLCVLGVPRGVPVAR